METLETRRPEKRDRMARPDWDPLTTTVGVSPIFHIRTAGNVYKSIDLSEVARKKVIQQKWKQAKAKLKLGRLLSMVPKEKRNGHAKPIRYKKPQSGQTPINGDSKKD